MGITKAYCTRVGAGPFPTELFDNDGEELRDRGNEFGSTTGRPRRCGWIDIPALRYACMLNGVTDLFVTKIDVLNSFEEVKVCCNYKIDGKLTDEIPFEFNSVEIEPQYEMYKGWNCDLGGTPSFDKLPERLQSYLKELENLIGVPVKAISISPDRKDVLFK